MQFVTVIDQHPRGGCSVGVRLQGGGRSSRTALKGRVSIPLFLGTVPGQKDEVVITLVDSQDPRVETPLADSRHPCGRVQLTKWKKRDFFPTRAGGELE